MSNDRVTPTKPGTTKPAQANVRPEIAQFLDRVKSLAMAFGLWVAPEMVTPDSDLYRQHPDWALHFPGRPRSEGRNQLILNFARKDVQEHIFGVLDRLLDVALPDRG